MPFLTIGGTTVEIQDDSVDREEYAVGEVRAAFSGAPRSSVRGYKARWSLETVPVTRATANTIKGLLQASPPISLTGDLTGTISAYALNIRMHSRSFAGGAEYVRLSFDLWEA